MAGWAGACQKVSRPCHLVTRCYNCKTPKPASPGAFGDSWLSSRMPRGKHKGRCPPSRVHAEPKAGMESLPCCLGTRPFLQVTAACPVPGIGRPPMSIASPVLPTSRCCVRCWQGSRLFRRSLELPGQEAKSSHHRERDLRSSHTEAARVVVLSGEPTYQFSVVGSAFPPRQSSAESFKLGCLREGKNRLAKFFIQTYLMFLPALPLPDFLVLRKQLPLAF